MKNKKVKFLTNLLMAIIIVSIFLVGFGGEKSVTISSSGENNPIYKGNQGVALMINVYENSEVVNRMLDLFVKKDVKATFFVGGCWADDNLDTIKRIIELGFELGNHGYFHKDHKKLSESENNREIKTCNDLIFKSTGYQMRLFAPPSGSFSKTTVKVAKNLQMQTIMWSKDTIDWRDSDKNLIVKRATSNIENGDLILMHPKTHTLDALTEIIDIIKQKQLKFETVSNCCNIAVL